MLLFPQFSQLLITKTTLRLLPKWIFLTCAAASPFQEPYSNPTQFSKQRLSIEHAFVSSIAKPTAKHHYAAAFIYTQKFTLPTGSKICFPIKKFLQLLNTFGKILMRCVEVCLAVLGRLACKIQIISLRKLPELSPTLFT